MIDARPERGSHRPGTFFYYNNWDFNTLGTIFEQTTSKRIFDAFEENIANKIGIVDFSPTDCSYLPIGALLYPTGQIAKAILG